MLPKPLKTGQHSRCLVIKHGKKAQQERSGHVSLPRVYCHKQVLLPNYSMTCCPALLCQSQAQLWLPSLHLNSSAGISPQCHIPVSLFTHSSEFTPSLQSVLLQQAMFTRVSCGFDTLQKTDLIYALQNSSTFRESTCGSKACSDSRGGTRSTSFTHNPLPLGEHRNPRDLDLL